VCFPVKAQAAISETHTQLGNSYFGKEMFLRRANILTALWLAPLLTETGLKSKVFVVTALMTSMALELGAASHPSPRLLASLMVSTFQAF
jgi:hypothetical protein